MNNIYDCLTHSCQLAAKVSHSLLEILKKYDFEVVKDMKAVSSCLKRSSVMHNKISKKKRENNKTT